MSKILSCIGRKMVHYSTQFLHNWNFFTRNFDLLINTSFPIFYNFFPKISFTINENGVVLECVLAIKTYFRTKLNPLHKNSIRYKNSLFGKHFNF